MIDMKNRADDEIERFLEVRAMGWEKWVLIVAVLYFAVRLAPWILDGCPVVAR